MKKKKLEDPTQYDCFADKKFLQMLPGLLARNEKRLTERRRALRQAEQLSAKDWQQRVGRAA